MLISRHVHCQRASATVSLTGPKGNIGDYLLKWKIASDGAATVTKNYRVIVNLTAVNVDPGAPALSLQVKPVLSCSGARYSGTCNIGALAVRRLDQGATLEYKFSVGFAWGGGSGTWEEFTFDTIELAHALPGQNIDTQGGRIGLSQPPGIRCDKDLAKVGSTGCVYAQKDAVYPLTVSSAAKEAAEHVNDAHAAGLPGAYVTSVGTRGVPLQRNQDKLWQETNRSIACGDSSGSLIRQRPTASMSCTLTPKVGCSCDEYPFASTWQGGTENSFVRYIRDADNLAGGGGNLSTRFYVRERVLDPFASGSGDNFWVAIR